MQIYKTDIGTVITLNTGVDLTGNTVSIDVRKPSGATANWAGAISADKLSIEHTVASGELDEVGTYVLQSKVTNGGSTWRGTPASLVVKNNFT